MLIRRRLVSAMCLLSIGSTVVCGQQKNPFAEWDTMAKQTDASISAPTAVRQRPQSSKPVGIQYFAPSTSPRITQESTAASSSSATTAPQSGLRDAAVTDATISSDAATANDTATTVESLPILSERLKSHPVQMLESASTPAAAPAEDGPLVDRPLLDSNFEVDAVLLQNRAPESSVRRANFSSEDNSGRIITPVGAINSDAPADDQQNPFAELLKTAAKDSPRKPGGNSQASFEISAGPTPAAAASPNSRLSPPFESAGTQSANAGPQSPGVTMQWIREGDLNVGQTCELQLQIQNTSRTTVRGVMVEASIPAELQVASVSPQPTTTSGTDTWALGEMSPGEKRSITFQVVPARRGEVHMDATVRLSGSSAAVFAVQEPMLAVTVDGPQDVEVGQQVTYTVRVNNPGTGVANNVLIQAAIPEGLEHRRGSLLTIEIGTLSPGEFRQAQLIVTAVRGGRHDMAVRVIAEGGLLDQTVSTVSIEEPRLNLQITGPTEQMAGRTAEYSLQVANEGGVPSANVRAKFRVPQGFEFVSADRGGKFSEVDRSIEWFVGTVASGTHSQFNVVLKATETGAVLHQAGVISEHGKVTMAEHAMRVDGTAVLDLKIAASQPQMAVNDEVTYEVRISNTGSRTAENVGVSCELPSALELLDVAGPSEYIAENGVMVFKSLPKIEAGKTAVFAIRLRCNREGSHRLRLRVASQSITEALIGEETAFVSSR